MIDGIPERGVPRLFVGNLVPGIGDTALRRALSRYGQVRAVDRHANYAHVSIVPADDGAVERCVASLNRTKWLGTELRVEKAVEHYLVRLQREWDQMQADEKARTIAAPRGAGLPAATAAAAALLPCGVYHQQDSEDSGKKTNETQGPHAGKWKGKRKVFDDRDDDDDFDFDFDDDHHHDQAFHGRERETDKYAVMGPHSDNQSDAAPDSSKMHRDEQDVIPTRMLPVETNHALSRRSHGTIATTLALFGLGEHRQDVVISSKKSEEDGPPAPKSLQNRDGMIHPAEPALRTDASSKRPRVALDAGYDAAVLAAEVDPRIVDTDRERDVALSVLQAMFPSELSIASAGHNSASRFRDQDEWIKINRRPGLLRSILARDTSSRHAASLDDTERVQVNKTKRLERQSTMGGLAPIGLLDNHAEGECAPSALPHRRPGLFRSLLSEQPSKVSVIPA
jgi:hypothetical protein